MAQNPQNHRRRTVGCFAALLSLGVFSILALAGWSLWQTRLGWATACIHRALQKNGISDLSFSLETLAPDRIVLRNVSWGTPRVITIDWFEARYSLALLRAGELDRIRIRGITLPCTVQTNATFTLPLLARITPLLQARATQPTQAGSTRKQAGSFRCGECSLYDLHIPLRTPTNTVLMDLNSDLSVVCIPGQTMAEDRYRITGNVRTSTQTTLAVYATLFPSNTSAEMTLEGSCQDLNAAKATALYFKPTLTPTLAPCTFTQAMLSARATVTLEKGFKPASFTATCELARGTRIAYANPETVLTLQSLRMDLSGPLTNVYARLSAGLSGVRFKEGVNLTQEEGRLISLRATAALTTTTQQTLRVSTSTDLAGRTAGRLLPQLIPLMPRFLTDGGTLETQLTLNQTSKKEGWTGGATFALEARRTTLSLAAGRTGAARIAVTGALDIVKNTPGRMASTLMVEDGFFRLPQSVGGLRSNYTLNMVATPPYAAAEGTFSGYLHPETLIEQHGVTLANTNGILYTGRAALNGLHDKPEWMLDLTIPSFGLAMTNRQLCSQAHADFAIRYREQGLSATGTVNLADIQYVHGSNTFIQAAIQTAGFAVALPEFNPHKSRIIQADIQTALHHGTLRIGRYLTIHDLDLVAPCTWHSLNGVQFKTNSLLHWRALDIYGLAFEPVRFTLTNSVEAMRISTALRAQGTTLNLNADITLPWESPAHLAIDFSIPETTVGTNDAIAAWLKQIDSAALQASAKVSATGDLHMLGGKPVISGRIRVNEGSLVRDNVKVDNIKVRIPFQIVDDFTTVRRPYMTFDNLRMGNVTLSNGRIEFQVSEQDIFIDRFEAAFCKGQINLYALRLNPDDLRVNAVVYIDRVDLGEVLMLGLPFRTQQAEGILFGRFPLAYRDHQLKLLPGYLYSLPGQGGKFRIHDSTEIEPYLEQAGIQGTVQKPLAKALSDMDFSQIRVELEAPTADNALLKFKLQGKSNNKEWPAPVDLNLNVRGSLESLLNLGLEMSQRKP